jgi:hypothetical protein
MMELVHGILITEYCDRHKLGVHEHWRLAERALVTEQGQFIGTPEYVSPEQAESTGPALHREQSPIPTAFGKGSYLRHGGKCQRMVLQRGSRRVSGDRRRRLE